MPHDEITVSGAREHNLRSINLTLPRGKMICFTGVSGSGKSSLAFDTLFAEGQRRYVESLSSYARQFMGQMPKPDVDKITGLSPAISISQKSTGHNPRSTVGTITEIYDFLRVLYARVGTGHCPDCGTEISAQTREQIVGQIRQLEPEAELLVLAPLIQGQKGEYRDLFESLRRRGFARARVDGRIIRLQDPPSLDRNLRHTIEVVVDRVPPGVRDRGRLNEVVEAALEAGEQTAIVLVDQSRGGAEEGARVAQQWQDAREVLFSSTYACPSCGRSFPPPSPQLFSFNSPQGMCTGCDGLGRLYTFVPELLVADEKKSVRRGALNLVGGWSDWGRYRQHIYRNAANAIEEWQELKSGTMLTTPWRDLAPELQHLWLWGAGSRELPFTWQSGHRRRTYMAHWDGLIPELVGKYHATKNKMQLRQLEKYMDTLPCPDCHGARLNEQARHVRLTTAASGFNPSQRSLSLVELCDLPVERSAEFISDLELSEAQGFIAGEALKEIRARLGFLLGVGLGYLTLSRTAPTLSGGESQRIRLAGQIGSGLVGVMYILDEPSIGLHPRDNDRLIETMLRLRQRGNTLIVVEHDEDTIRAADLVVDFGPGPGVKGGKVVGCGSVEDVAASRHSLTGKFLSGKEKIAVPKKRRSTEKESLRIVGARHNNLRDLQIDIPLGTLVCVTGVSGSGKSSLVGDILEPALRRDLNGGESEPGEFDRLEGLDQLDKMIAIDQSPIGRTPRSNPATYVKVFDEIRNLFTQLPEARRRGYGPGRFSFNVDGGRCAACDGNGASKLEMDFLADVWVTCPVCEGRRYNRETLQVQFKEHSIADVLDLDISQAIRLFKNIPKVHDKLVALRDVGLEYLKLGQPSPTLSGGEAQRIKLTRELSKRSTGRTIYLLDEPTTGLHFADIRLLLKVLHGLVDRGNTVLVVEHNLDVIKTADWVIDLGPEGGAGGGRVVACGTPEEIASRTDSYTGTALRRVFDGTAAKTKRAVVPRSTSAAAPQPLLKSGNGAADAITVEGAEEHNLKGIDISVPRGQMSVFCGPSGSGKTSLAMDTIYAEGQRRYVESLSSYARQFIGQAQKPRVERIEGLSPAVALEQKNVGHTPRSTVGTVTEIYDYLRIFFARLGAMYCPTCEQPVQTQTPDEITDKVLALPAGTKCYLLAPRDRAVGLNLNETCQRLKADGYARVRIDGRTFDLDNMPAFDLKAYHDMQIVVDRLKIDPASRSRIAESVELALSIGAGTLQLAIHDADRDERDWEVITHSQHRVCGQCARSFEALTPHHFSFNSSLGWCPQCEGIGTQTGTNPAALFRAHPATLADGAALLWPGVDKTLSRLMLESLSKQTGIPLDEPVEHFSVRDRRLLLYGTGERWFEVRSSADPSAAEDVAPRFRFQYKGLYPALSQAARMSPTLRARLEQFVDVIDCATCAGSRLRDDAAAVRFEGLTIADIVSMPLDRLDETVRSWKLEPRRRKVAGELLREIRSRVKFLLDVGLDYLTLNRAANTLSGGEAQRIRLASQLGSGLCGLTYVLDEPTIGLHPRDNGRLLSALHGLRDLDNTLLVVEHDRDVIAGSDHLFDFGPGSGRFGGRIMASGTPKKVEASEESLTGRYLSGRESIPVPPKRRITVLPHGEPKIPGAGWLTVYGAAENSLQNVDVSFPLGSLCVVTGVSGSGKSSLIDDILYPALARQMHRARVRPGRHREIRGTELIDKVIRVDQSPLAGTATSNPATYTGAFDLIRHVFATLPESWQRGFTSRTFSFNVPGGRCEACEGAGQRCIEMHFLPDVWIPCDDCRGRRYTAETLEVKYHGKSIADCLEMQITDAIELFHDEPKIVRILQTLADVGLGYLTLGQSAPTLSGGEAQRVKLAAELARPDTGRTLYLLDEPTTGLHFDDIRKLSIVLHRLVDSGNTVVVIEHNLDVIKQADWIIDMGPEAGVRGGRLVVAGTPEQVVDYGRRHRPKPNGRGRKGKNGPQAVRSYTGEFLEKVLAESPVAELQPVELPASRAAADPEPDFPAPLAPTDATPGKLWHTVSLLDRNGDPVRWDGRLMTAIMDRIEQDERLRIDWSKPNRVDVRGAGLVPGWFLRAFSAERWWLKLKFHVPRGSFDPILLGDELALPPLNRLVRGSGVPRERRMRFKQKRDAQEVELRLHRWEDVDRPAFWDFLDKAIEAFFGADSPLGGNGRGAPLAALQPPDLQPDSIAPLPQASTPWAALGRRWHELGKGFPGGERCWQSSLAKRVFDTLEIAANGLAQLNWSDKEQVTATPAGQQRPAVVAETKRLDALHLVLSCKASAVPLQQLGGLGVQGNVRVEEDTAIVRLALTDDQNVDSHSLQELLREHLRRAGEA